MKKIEALQETDVSQNRPDY